MQSSLPLFLAFYRLIRQLHNREKTENKKKLYEIEEQLVIVNDRRITRTFFPFFFFLLNEYK